jgi:hypothetical protein
MAISFAAVFREAPLPGAVKFGPTAAPRASSYIETAAVVSICAVLIYVMTKPAFDGFFIGEDFNTTSVYIAHGQHLLMAIFTPLNGFFRPTAYAWILLTQNVLPWDPVIHHWRNFLVLILCAWLLYRIMIRLTDSLQSRLIGIAFFSISKVHLTLIGLINCIEVLGTVVYALATFLFMVRYFQGARIFDYILAVLCFALCAFARDTNVLFFFVIVFAFAANAWQSRGNAPNVWRRMLVKSLPFVLLVVAYGLTRYMIVGLPQTSGSGPYSLYFEPMHILARLGFFIGNLVNVPFDEQGANGLGDLSTALGASDGLQRVYGRGLAAIAVIAFLIVLFRAMRLDIGCLVPLSWACILLTPTLLIGNRQIYYMFEPLTALSLFLAVALGEDVRNRLLQLAVWVPLIFLIAANGYVSNQSGAKYTWRWVAIEGALLNEQIYKKHRGELIKGLTIVTDDQERANFTRYVVFPVGLVVPGRVPLLNVFISPTVESFRVIPFKDLSLEEFNGAVDQLVYRYNTENESYTNLTERTIGIASIESDSSLDSAHDASRLLEGAGGEWLSAVRPGPHSVTINLNNSTTLSSIRIHNPSDRRIGAIEVSVFSTGSWKTVFDKDHLESEAIIDARWADVTAKAVQVVIKSSFHNGAPIDGAAIQRIEFPENRQILPQSPAP